jgi:hypothetical protein
MEMADRTTQRTLFPLMSAVSLARSQRGRKKRDAKQRKQEALHEIALRKASADFAEPAFADADDATFEDDDHSHYEPGPGWRKRKLLLGLVLLPVCVVAAVTLLELFFRATVDGKFWMTEGFWFFMFGGALWIVMGFARVQPGWLYVFAHEFTHALTARLSGGEIHAMHVTEDGGFIETDKSNWFITLSPYLVPLYTMVVFALYGLLSVFVDMNQLVIFTVPLLDLTMWLKWVWAVYFLVGLTWCFHFTFTIQVLHTEQSDLRQNGEFFSMMLIFVVNLALIGSLFIAASPTVGWADVANDAKHMVEVVCQWVMKGVASLKARI